MPQPPGCYRSRTILRYLPRETDFPGDAKNGGPRGNATSSGLTATLSKFLSRFIAGSRTSLSFPEKRRAAVTTFGMPWSPSDKLDARSRYTSRHETDIAVTRSDWMSVKSNERCRPSSVCFQRNSVPRRKMSRSRITKVHVSCSAFVSRSR